MSSRSSSPSTAPVGSTRKRSTAGAWSPIRPEAASDLRLVSRKGVEHTVRFPDLVKAIASLSGTSLVLDGEVAVFDERLVSRFDLLGDPSSDVPTTRPVFIAFDVLYARGRDLRAQPLE
jgi:bifunctional non-homologous end joining protein LigD